ncbi:MAG: protein kinase [Kofleriaceae bacterium]
MGEREKSARAERFLACPACLAIYRTEFARCPHDGEVLAWSEVDPLIGATIAHYTIEACIGAGAMGRVYRAHHQHLEHRRAAIKILAGELAAIVEMRLRFAHEADAASRLDHPNVVPVIDFGKSDRGLLYLAMELVEGRSLAEVLATGGALPVPRALGLVRQISLGLAHAHALGLVHRDLKPENVLVDGHDVARIVDFGLAIRADETSTRLTQVGLAFGTPVYAAPEQTHNEPVDHRADLFSLGVTLYELVAGRPPYDGSMADLVRQNATSAPPAIALRTGIVVPIDIELVIRRLMERDPAARFPDARSVIEAIDAIRAAPIRTVALPPIPARRHRRRRIALAGALAVAGIVVSIAAIETESAPVARLDVPVAPVAPAPAPPLEGPQRPVPELPALPAVPPRPSRRRPPAPAPPHLARPTKPPQPAPPTPEPTAEPASTPSIAASIAVPIVTQEPVPMPPTSHALPPPVWTTADVTIEDLHVLGSLTDGDVRRGVERVMPALRTCYQTTARTSARSPAATVLVGLAIDDARHATNIRATGEWAQLATCVRGALDQVRTQSAPDVGDVETTFRLGFQPVAP